jgi:restriction system protein
LFEKVVADVFQSTGFSARVTSYQADGGIDVILDGPNDKTIGVQVKRYRNTIRVEQIRALAGALLLAGHTKGIFVATSSYSSAAKKAAARYTARGLPIELIDATRFYDALLVAQRACYRSPEELTNEIGAVNYESIYENEGPTYLFL